MLKLAISRQSGKSNQQVVVELVAEAPPGTVFSYDRIAAALSEGAGKTYTRAEVQSVVRTAADSRLLREYRRTLANVRGVGYKVAAANEHVPIAGAYNRKSIRSLKRGTDRLNHARLEELTEAERLTHEQQREVNNRLYSELRRIDRVQERHRVAIASTTQRVEQLEAAVADLKSKG